jgi:hypothetical protein
VVQERYDRLVALVEETTFAENQKLAGAAVEVLVAEGEGRKDAATHRMSGRARDNRLVHFAPHGLTPRPGDVVTVAVTRAAPHYLLSDAEPLSLLRPAGHARAPRLADVPQTPDDERPGRRGRLEVDTEPAEPRAAPGQPVPEGSRPPLSRTAMPLLSAARVAAVSASLSPSRYRSKNARVTRATSRSTVLSPV